MKYKEEYKDWLWEQIMLENKDKSPRKEKKKPKKKKMTTPKNYGMMAAKVMIPSVDDSRVMLENKDKSPRKEKKKPKKKVK